MKNILSFLKQTNWIERIGFVISVTIIIIASSSLNSCTKESVIQNIEQKKSLPIGITADITNPDKSHTIYFIKLFDGTTHYENSYFTISKGFTMTEKINETCFEICDGGWTQIGFGDQAHCPPGCNLTATN